MSAVVDPVHVRPIAPPWHDVLGGHAAVVVYEMRTRAAQHLDPRAAKIRTGRVGHNDRATARQGCAVPVEVDRLVRGDEGDESHHAAQQARAWRDPALSIGPHQDRDRVKLDAGIGERRDDIIGGRGIVDDREQPVGGRDRCR